MAWFKTKKNGKDGLYYILQKKENPERPSGNWKWQVIHGPFESANQMNKIWNENNYAARNRGLK